MKGVMIVISVTVMKIQITLLLQLPLLDSSSSESDEDDDPSIPSTSGSSVPSTSANSTTQRRLIWKTIQNKVQDQYVPPTLSIPNEIKSLIEQFKYFFDDNILDQSAHESNLYAIQKNPDKPLRLTRSELEQFIGCCMYMPIFKLPRYRMYWSLNTGVESIASILSRQHWEQIKSNLHFNNNENMPSLTDPDRYRLFKLRPLIDHLLFKFQAIPQDQTLCIDEKMIPFKGVSGLKQYFPKKPHKWGYKIFITCNVKGLVYNFNIYTGKILPVPGYPDLGASSNIVLKMIQIVEKNANHLLYCDNWFTSIQLLVALAKLEVYAVGTIRSNRLQGCSFSNDAILKKKERGAYEEKETTIDSIPIRAVKWFDNRPVVVASTFAKAASVGSVERFDRKTKQQSQSSIHQLKQYNGFMGGVDTLDAYLAYYRTQIRSKKCYLRFFFHFCDLALVNS